MVLPVLVIGLVLSPMFTYAVPLAPEPLAFAALSAGGAIGVVGWVRAHWGVREPEAHGIATTLVFIAIGIATAFAIAAMLTVEAIDQLSGPYAELRSALPAIVFATATGLWIVSGVAWMERLTHRYLERTGREYDSLPVVLLLVALALVAAVFVAASFA